MDWEVLLPGISFTLAGLLGLWISFETNFLFPAETFVQGLHATAMFVLVLGLLLIPGGLLKGGTPAPKGLSAAVVATLLTCIGTATLLFIIVY